VYDLGRFSFTTWDGKMRLPHQTGKEERQSEGRAGGVRDAVETWGLSEKRCGGIEVVLNKQEKAE